MFGHLFRKQAGSKRTEPSRLNATAVPHERVREVLKAVLDAGLMPVNIEMAFEGSVRIWFCMPPDADPDDWTTYPMEWLNDRPN